MINKSKIKHILKNIDYQEYINTNSEVEELLNNKSDKEIETYMLEVGLRELFLGNHQLYKNLPSYSEKNYLSENPDVKKAVTEGAFTTGFEHFLIHGLKTIIEKNNRFQKLLNIFDSDYYIKQNPLLDEEILDKQKLLQEYLTIGWKNGLKPTIWFDTTYYTEQYLDISQKNIEPFSHFVKAGWKEKRIPNYFITKDIYDTIHSIEELNTMLTPNYLTYLETKYLNAHKPHPLNSSSLPFFPIDPESQNNILNIEKETKEYIEYKSYEQIDTAIQAIAFYLPQFHPFPENDLWWGKGFTEWANVTKATPNFVGHKQPHLPIHNGFYDLRVEEVMIEQVKLAKNYGIYGFNYYYYWFNGKILMDLPLKNMLKNKEIDMPFCLTWANENWTRTWDGSENDILIAQDHSKEDSLAFIHNLFEYFHDKRYIRIDDKPLLIIYRADIIKDIAIMSKMWREEAIKEGFKDLYLVSAQTFGITDPSTFEFDASMEFPPHGLKSHVITENLSITNNHYKGHIYDYATAVKNAIINTEPAYKLHKTVMLGWDNTARRQNNSNIFSNYSTNKFKQWFSAQVNCLLNQSKYSQKLIFINAWNEWAEGTHLEPDRNYGYAALDSVHQVLHNYKEKYINKIFPKKKIIKSHNIAVILHLHYIDMWDEIKSSLSNFGNINFDLYISITSTELNIINRILSTYPKATIFLFDNRGRDIYPFIQVLQHIIPLEYMAVCKLHSKKSVYRDDGQKIKNELFAYLIKNEEHIQNIIELFREDQNIGLVCPEKYSIMHNEKNMRYNHQICSTLENVFKKEFVYSSFPAGSMYWFRPTALKELCQIKSQHIPPEEGWTDGTVIHGIERFIEVIVKSNNFKVFKLKDNF
jgi:lipopolysaccharide biosynthesis protein